MGPVEVGGDNPQAGAVPLRRQDRGAQGEVECGAESVWRDFAGEPERSADVLVVDEAVGQPDPAAEPVSIGRRGRPPLFPLWGSLSWNSAVDPRTDQLIDFRR